MPYPRVTVLLPVYNEEAFIDACLESLQGQDYPEDIQILVVDGGSSDRTLAILEAWRDALPGLEVLDNPERVQSHGLNLAAEAASGAVLVRADAHSTYAADYLRRSVDALRSTGATAVGGLQTPDAASGFGAAVAEAMRSPLATGPARFRHAREVEEVDTVYLGAFRKDDFLRLGGYRTLPSRVAEDADLYHRWRRQGARILVDPAIVSRYTPRDTPRSLWRQYFRYGMGKADMLYVNGRWPSWRPAGPMLLVIGILVGLALGVVWIWWPLALLLASWVLALAVAGRGRPSVMVAAGIMHLAYGLGLLRGLLRRPDRVRTAVVSG